MSKLGSKKTTTTSSSTSSLRSARAGEELEEITAEKYMRDPNTLCWAGIAEIRPPFVPPFQMPIAPSQLDNQQQQQQTTYSSSSTSLLPSERNHLLSGNRDIEMGYGTDGKAGAGAGAGAGGGAGAGAGGGAGAGAGGGAEDEKVLVMFIAKGSEGQALHSVMQRVVGGSDLLVDHRKCFGADPRTRNHQIVYDVEDEWMFIAASHQDDLPARISFAFLQRLKELWLQHVNHSHRLPQKELVKLQRSFVKIMDDEMVCLYLHLGLRLLCYLPLDPSSLTVLWCAIGVARYSMVQIPELTSCINSKPRLI
jgi:hypothetical protein